MSSEEKYSAFDCSGLFAFRSFCRSLHAEHQSRERSISMLDVVTVQRNIEAPEVNSFSSCCSGAEALSSASHLVNVQRPYQ